MLFARREPLPALAPGSMRAALFTRKRDATDLETASTQAQIDRLFQVGELIRNELDNDRDAGAVRLADCAS